MAATKPDVTGCQMYYQMNETSGNRTDEVGSYTLTDVNTVGYRTGVQGNAALAVGGSSEHLYRYDGAEFNFFGGGNSWTIFGWLYATSLPSSHMRPLCKYSSTQKQFLMYRHYTFGASYLAAYVYNTSGASANSRTAIDIPSAAWFSVTVRFDGTTGDIVLRVGGVNQTKGTLAGTQKDGSASLKFGNYDGASSGYWNGAWDEFSFWDSYLTDDECLWMENSGSGRTWADHQSVVTPTLRFTRALQGVGR